MTSAAIQTWTSSGSWKRNARSIQGTPAKRTSFWQNFFMTRAFSCRRTTTAEENKVVRWNFECSRSSSQPNFDVLNRTGSDKRVNRRWKTSWRLYPTIVNSNTEILLLMKLKNFLINSLRIRRWTSEYTVQVGWMQHYGRNNNETWKIRWVEH